MFINSHSNMRLYENDDRYSTSNTNSCIRIQFPVFYKIVIAEYTYSKCSFINSFVEMFVSAGNIKRSLNGYVEIVVVEMIAGFQRCVPTKQPFIVIIFP